MLRLRLDPGELEHLAKGKHTYTEVLAFGIPIVVCNFCLVDFSSYDPAFFNRPARTKLGLGEFVELRAITNPSLGKDKFCPVCRRRLAFLKFVEGPGDVVCGQPSEASQER